ncbi:FtsX-like permease family protein [Nakamurella aerolata]|uniref:ABC3 transporter permease C-terminal domain-containing protein n=1 Tax=Nakamurella aerolata TaxID=1656892 RepID=A0A849A5I1_9ACTN|nr:FtsX-like permease family protein [Nakamurella aerolata]NNG35819.1 hypothetical protein [Nakamurella aerolata]
MSGLGLLVRRIALAGGWRSVLTIAQVLVIAALTVTGAVLLAALNDTQDRLIAVVNNGANASLAIEPTPASLTSTLSRLPAGLDPQPKVIDTLMPVQANGMVGTEYFMQRNFSGPAGGNYRVDSGRLPTAPSEVAISPSAARQYRLAVGGTIALELDHDRPARVVGIARQRDDFRQSFVIAAPGTWEALRPSAAVAAALAPSVDIAVNLNTADGTTVAAISQLGNLTFSSDIPSRKPIYLRLIAVIGFPMLALAGAAVGAVLVVRLRWQVDEFTLLAAVGVPQRTVRAAVLISSAALITGGVLGGLGLALVAAPLLAGPAEQIAQRQLDLSFPPAEVLIGVAAVIVAAGLAVVIGYGRVQTAVLRSGGGGRAAGEGTINRQEGSTRRIVQFCGVVLLASLLVTGPSSEAAMGLVVVGCLVTLSATAPDLLRMAHATLGRTASPVGMASRWASRERWRAGAIATVVMASLVLPAALLVRSTSYAQTNADRASTNVLPGQLEILSPTPLPAAQLERLSTIAGAAPVVARTAVGRNGVPAGLRDFTSNGTVGAIDDPAATEELWGFALAPQSIADLRAGKLVVFDPAGPRAVTAVLDWSESPGTAGSNQATVPSAPAHLASPATARVSIPGALILSTQLPAGLTTDSSTEYRFADAASQLAQMQNAAADMEIPPSAVRAYRAISSEPPGPEVEMSALVAAIACVLLSLLLTAQAMREWRRELFQLADLGYSRGGIARIAVWAALIAGTVGALLGVIGGAVISVANVRTEGAGTDIPWLGLLTLAAGAVAVQAAAGVAAGASARRAYSRHPLAPRSR